MGFWTSIVNYGKSAARGSGRVLTYTVAHPKQVAITGAAGYAGWQYLANDRPLIDSAGDMVEKAADVTFGEKRVDKAVEIAGDSVTAVSDTISAVGDKIDSATETLSGAVNTAKETTNALSGIGNFLQGLTSGNGLGMIGGFFKNLASGNVGGLGIAGLIGAAILCFGRFGFLGKMLGGLLAMMVIGNNFKPAVAQTQAPQQSPERQQTPQVTAPQPTVTEAPVMHRGR